VRQFILFSLIAERVGL